MIEQLKIRKIDWYIIKKFLGTYFYAIALIISIAVVFDISEKIDDFIEKEAPLRAIVFEYYLTFIPYFANLFSSLFTFIAVIFFTSKMAYNTEIIAILSSGVSFRRLMWPYFLSSLVIAILSFSLMSYVIPPANKVRLEFTYKYIKNPYRNKDKNIHRQVEPGVFVYMRGYNTTNQIAYKFTVEKIEDGKLLSKMISDYAKWDTTINAWNLKNYYIREIDGMNEIIRSGSEIDTVLNLHPDDLSRYNEFVETMTLTELNDFIDDQKMQGADNIDALLIEKHGRVAYPFSTFILTIIGVTLSSKKIRGGIGMHIGAGVLLSFSYILFMRFSTMFAISGTFNPFVAVWFPNFVYSIISIFLYRIAPK